MKVIDLLNKIANGEIDYTTKFDAKVNMGYCGINEYFERYPINENYLNCEIELNDEVEIIEEKEMCHKCHKYPAEYNQTWCEFCLGISKEEKKIPEKLEFGRSIENGEEILTVPSDKMIIIKINEIIDYLKSKGE